MAPHPTRKSAPVKRHALTRQLALVVRKWLGGKIAGHWQKDKKASRFCCRGHGRCRHFITVEHLHVLLELQKYACFHCGCRLLLGPNRGAHQASADRIRNHEAHVVGNCVMACLGCNRRRQARTIEAFAAAAGTTRTTTAALAIARKAAEAL